VPVVPGPARIRQDAGRTPADAGFPARDPLDVADRPRLERTARHPEQTHVSLRFCKNNRSCIFVQFMECQPNKIDNCRFRDISSLTLRLTFYSGKFVNSVQRAQVVCDREDFVENDILNSNSFQ